MDINTRTGLFILWASGAIAHCYLFIGQVKEDKNDMEKDIPAMTILPPNIVNSIIVFSVGFISFFWPIFMVRAIYKALRAAFKKDSV